MSKAKALRLQAHYAKQKDALLRAITISMDGTEKPLEPVECPKRMKLDETPENVLRGFDVYLNGNRQVSCYLADVEANLIKKWPIGRGGLADKSKPLETHYGCVQIVPKGEKPCT